MPQTYNCPLRGLTLCDGQLLEESPGVLTGCLCSRIVIAEDHSARGLCKTLRAQRLALVARANGLPLLRFDD